MSNVQTEKGPPEPQSAVGPAPLVKSVESRLLMEMYKSLRCEIRATMRENAQLVTYGILATGAVWYYAVSLPPTSYPKLILAIPPVLALLFLLRALGLLLEGQKTKQTGESPQRMVVLLLVRHIRSELDFGRRVDVEVEG